MSVSENLNTNLSKVLNFIETAAAQKIDIIGFPEMSLTGYTPEVVFSENLNSLMDTSLKQIQKKCCELNIAAIIGHPYKNGYNLYNRASAILPNGQTFIYNKTHLVDLEKKFFTPGNDLLAFCYRDEKIGVIICRDQNDPTLCVKLKGKGVKYIYILSAHYYKPKEARWKIDKNKAIPITRAVENNVYTLLPNTVGSHLGMVSLGYSLIAGPDGALVVLAGESEETILSLCNLDY
jgi:predicted amidohydrolase